MQVYHESLGTKHYIHFSNQKNAFYMYTYNNLPQQIHIIK